MDSTFGERLRTQRERQQIPLTTIAEMTKIKLALLEALERNDFARWPLGLFGRSYLRSYATAVGLDPEATVREFMALQKTVAPDGAVPIDDLREVLPDTRTSKRPPTRIQFLIDSAIDALHARRAEFGQATFRASKVLQSPPAPVPVPVSEAAPEPQPESFAVSLPVQRFVPEPALVDFSRIAHLCTRLACAQESEDVMSALDDASNVLDAVGLILWIPESMGAALMPAFARGYPDEMLAQLPRVPTSATNAVAEAFRTRSTCVVNANDGGTGALVAALATPTGCSGVLAIELREGAERREEVRAAVTILAAQLSTLMGVSVIAQMRSA